MPFDITEASGKLRLRAAGNEVITFTQSETRREDPIQSLSIQYRKESVTITLNTSKECLTMLTEQTSLCFYQLVDKNREFTHGKTDSGVFLAHDNYHLTCELNDGEAKTEDDEAESAYCVIYKINATQHGRACTIKRNHLLRKTVLHMLSKINRRKR